ncbi:hypothetical protein ICN22_08290 [Polynucleobacter sp. AP-Basta-1000A-D1]|nr:hypothetical protein [Polynucleobacter bastaniensis]
MQDDQLDIAWTMPKQPISTAAKIRKLVMNFTKWLLYVLLILVLAYASFKVWEYKGEYEKEKEAKILAKEQEIEFNDLRKNLATYAPLLVGSPSSILTTRANGKFILAYMLGAEVEAFQNAFEESIPIIYVGSQLLGAGCKKSDCEESSAAFVIEPANGKVYLALRKGGELTFYGLEDSKTIPLAFEKWQGFKKAGVQ